MFCFHTAIFSLWILHFLQRALTSTHRFQHEILHLGSPDPWILKHIWSVIGRATGRMMQRVLRLVGVSPPSILFDRLYEGKTPQPGVVSAYWAPLWTHHVDLSFVMNTNIQRCLTDAERAWEEREGRRDWNSGEASGSNLHQSEQDRENGFRVASANPTHHLFPSAQDWCTTWVNSMWKHLSRRLLLLTAQNIRRRPLARAWSQTGIRLPAAHRKLIKCKEILCFQKPQLGRSKTIDHREENSLSYHNILLIYSFYLKIKVHPKNLCWFENANVLKCF